MKPKEKKERVEETMEQKNARWAKQSKKALSFAKQAGIDLGKVKKERNKIEAEKKDYERLKEAGIRIPDMFDIDEASERIVKEYIEGPTVFEMVRDGISVEPLMIQISEMAELAKAAGLNIDYFLLLYYVDYECNQYMEEWNMENWGIKYWRRTAEFEEYLENHT